MPEGGASAADVEQRGLGCLNLRLDNEEDTGRPGTRARRPRSVGPSLCPTPKVTGHNPSHKYAALDSNDGNDHDRDAAGSYCGRTP